MIVRLWTVHIGVRRLTLIVQGSVARRRGVLELFTILDIHVAKNNVIPFFIVVFVHPIRDRCQFTLASLLSTAAGHEVYRNENEIQVAIGCAECEGIRYTLIIFMIRAILRQELRRQPVSYPTLSGL